MTDEIDSRYSGKVCHACGAKMIEYKFGFNKGLVVFLNKLFLANGPAKSDSLGMTYSQRTNSQKLRYWGLAVPFVNEESKSKAGWWKITQKGRDFLSGATRIPKYVIMYRNDFVRYEGEDISISDVEDGYLYRIDYKEQVKSQLTF